MNRSSLEAAAEAAARVNAMLIAKGKLKLPPTQLKPKIGPTPVGRGSGDLFTAEVEINDAPLSARNLLTRGHTQDEICKYSGAAISTRGRYMTLEERQKNTTESRPLYLHVQASSQGAVNLAVARIQDVINQHVRSCGGVMGPNVGAVTYPPPVTNGSVPHLLSVTAAPLSSGPHFVQDKVFVGLEHSSETFPVKDRILGPGGSYLHHIRTETGATVTLRGKGSGFIEPTSGREAFEPLHIHITHPKLDGLQAAKALTVNLIETTHADFVQWQQQETQPLAQALTSVSLHPATQITYQPQLPLVNASTPSLSISPAVVPTSVPLAVAVPLGSSVPSHIQTSVNLPVYSVASPASASALAPILSSSAGILVSQPQSAIAYPTTFVTNNSPAVASHPIAAVSAPTVPRLTVTSAYTSVVAAQPLVSQHSQIPVSQYLSVPTQMPQSQAAAITPVSPVYNALSQALVSQAVASSVLTSSSTSPSGYTYPHVATPVYPISGPASVSPVPAPPISVSTVSTAYPHIQYPLLDSHHHIEQKRKFSENPVKEGTSNSNHRLLINNLQASLLKHSLEEASQQRVTGLSHKEGEKDEKANKKADKKDRELMPPPPSSLGVNKDAPAEKVSRSSETGEPERKRLKGALGGLAAVYGSDDSDDESSPVGSPTPISKRPVESTLKFSKNFNSHTNKPLM